MASLNGTNVLFPKIGYLSSDRDWFPPYIDPVDSTPGFSKIFAVELEIPKTDCSDEKEIL
jgi:hypothetical protein